MRFWTRNKSSIGRPGSGMSQYLRAFPLSVPIRSASTLQEQPGGNPLAGFLLAASGMGDMGFSASTEPNQGVPSVPYRT